MSGSIYKTCKNLSLIVKNPYEDLVKHKTTAYVTCMWCFLGCHDDCYSHRLASRLLVTYITVAL
jgi:hypothetical protein